MGARAFATEIQNDAEKRTLCRLRELGIHDQTHNGLKKIVRSDVIRFSMLPPGLAGLLALRARPRRPTRSPSMRPGQPIQNSKGY